MQTPTEMAHVPAGRSGANSVPGMPAEPERLQPDVLTTPVLIVEDEAMIAWMLETLLEDMGFEAITVVATGEEGLAAAERLSPGLILSDINLGPSGMDGVAAASRIRRTSSAPILFVTGYAGPEALDRIRRDVPGSLVLRKPITADVFREAVTDLTKRDRSN